MLSELLKNNRSYRRFYENHKISKELLLQFIDNIRYVPTARNQQILVYKPITDKTECENIFPELKWAGYLKNWDGPQEGEHPTAYIIIAINKKRIKFNDQWINTDLGIAIQSILLQAVEQKLGGCTIAAFNKKNIYSKLNISKEIEPKIIIALGKPKKDVIIEEIGNNKSIKYYKKNDLHIVPKRKLNDILF